MLHTGEFSPKEAGKWEVLGRIECFVVNAPWGSDFALVSVHELTHPQQRFMDVQRIFGLDDAIVKCQLELSACDVITAWASGCSWNDALFIAGSCTGGLGEDAEPRIIPAMALQNGIAPLGATWGTILRSSLMPRRGPISRLYRFISLRTLATSRGCAAFFLPRRCGCKMSTRAQHM